MVYGDLGVHSESMANIKLDAFRGSYSAIIHAGDFGYDIYNTITSGQYTGKNVSLACHINAAFNVSNTTLSQLHVYFS